MELQPGWAEFNDADAIIRGRMVAASGTFSGTFSADNVEAVQEINIRNGAASAYYGFSFPGGSTDISFSIDPQPHTNIADLVVPCSIIFYGRSYKDRDCGFISLYKDGALIGNERIFYGGIESEDGVWDKFSLTQVIRYIDMGVSSSQPSTYRVVLTPGGVRQYATAVSISIVGVVVVGVRKR